MAETNDSKALSWLKIILILIGASLVTGLLLGFIGTFFNLPPSVAGTGTGAVVGVLAAILITQRRTAPARPDESRSLKK